MKCSQRETATKGRSVYSVPRDSITASTTRRSIYHPRRLSQLVCPAHLLPACRSAGNGGERRRGSAAHTHVGGSPPARPARLLILLLHRLMHPHP
ncbi:hypothetical protein E2C01_057081 [Portunus trituberculatus]|uniref:Uncharacterized protein n=1 Tax=Portunus trituberculatus TaxID=210409 RepID=A0A5B7GSI5_PORTR|nr:hypothetical protein [Portunus trituberculatus]